MNTNLQNCQENFKKKCDNKQPHPMNFHIEITMWVESRWQKRLLIPGINAKTRGESNVIIQIQITC